MNISKIQPILFRYAESSQRILISVYTLARNYEMKSPNRRTLVFNRDSVFID
jgi:hypothetical protein